MGISDKQVADGRQRFIDSAFELFPWQASRTTSMNGIAKHSGGSRANLYLHVRNKPDIVLARMRELEPSSAACAGFNTMTRPWSNGLADSIPELSADPDHRMHFITPMDGAWTIHSNSSMAGDSTTMRNRL